jgi:hypothetical protein
VGSLGKVLVVAGAAIALVGVLLLVGERFPGLRIGRLPGDIAIGNDRFRLYLPIGTSILVSILLTVLLWLLGRRG